MFFVALAAEVCLVAPDIPGRADDVAVATIDRPLFPAAPPLERLVCMADAASTVCSRRSQTPSPSRKHSALYRDSAASLTGLDSVDERHGSTVIATWQDADEQVVLEHHGQGEP